MTETSLDVIINEALETFMKGAKTQHAGYYLDNIPLQKEGAKILSAAVAIIDEASPTGRDVLLPLLDHKNEAVRVSAAGGLWESHPDIVIPLLQDMERLSITEAGDTAMMILMTKGRFNTCKANPKFPDPPQDGTNPSILAR